MEIDQEELMKHVCKLCNKRYPSGKSLGGHMRSHVIADYKKNKLLQQQQQKNNNNNNNNKATNFIVDYEDDEEEEDEDGYGEDYESKKESENGGNSGYGLRENPKKSWRLVNSKVDKYHQQQQQQQQNGVQEVQEERVCKQCGKKFQSLKALCGHMSSHSDKEKKFKDNEDDNSWFSGSLSDNNNNIKNSNDNMRQTRASMSRYNNNNNNNNNNNSFGGGGSSSNNSEIDQLEQEEVAMCLMMLSRDTFDGGSYNRKGFNFGPESSDNNSVILEGGGSSNFKKKKDLVFMCSDGGGDKKKQVVVQDLDNSDSGYFENGAKELESDDSVDGFAKNNYYYGIQKPVKSHDQGSGLVLSCDDRSKRKIRYVGNYFGFNNNLESEENSSKKMAKDQHAETSKITFKTHHAHNVTNANFDGTSSANGKNLATYNSNNNDSNYNYVKKGSGGSKKVKTHKCPYCPKVYKSGQALGGHKRSHMMGSGRGGGGGGVGVVFNRFNARAPTPEPEPESEQKQPLIDLNLPAPLEEESENSQW